MSDSALQQLLRTMQGYSIDKRRLWLVDENVSAQDIAAVQADDNLFALTNRCDLYQQLLVQGIQAELNDFDVTVFAPNSFDAMFYRVSKEKAIVHHVINSAEKCLKPGAECWLAGFKNEGAKTYINKAAGCLGEMVSQQRGDKAALLACIAWDGKSIEPLDDKQYRQTIELAADGLSFFSKPGIYGWNKIDKGSAFLVEQLPEFFKQSNGPVETILDLGCGFGYLSVMASVDCSARIIATDNNITSIILCEKNFAKHQVQGEVRLADCAEGIEQPVDVVLCNPPFHQGFEVDGDLTLRFVAAARRLLKPSGSALFVVNSFIPLEKKAKGIFREVELVANNGSFKVLRLI